MAHRALSVFGLTKSQPKSDTVNSSKRRFLRGRISQVTKESKAQSLRLPWIINEHHFTQGCTQCEGCINACETNIITKDAMGFPVVDFTLGECSFCNKCIDHCQEPLFSGRFLEYDQEKSEHTEAMPWPVAIEVSDKCLAKHGIYCQSCRDECEPNAIEFNYINSSIPQPQINLTDCTQCGACISSCPQDALITSFGDKERV